MEAALLLLVIVGVCAWAIIRSRRRLDDFSRSRREDGDEGPKQDWRER